MEIRFVWLEGGMVFVYRVFFVRAFWFCMLGDLRSSSVVGYFGVGFGFSW